MRLLSDMFVKIIHNLTCAFHLRTLNYDAVCFLFSSIWSFFLFTFHLMDKTTKKTTFEIFQKNDLLSKNSRKDKFKFLVKICPNLCHWILSPLRISPVRCHSTVGS